MGGMRVEYSYECERSRTKVTSVNTTRCGISEIIFCSLGKLKNKTSTPIPGDAPESSTHTATQPSHSTLVHAVSDSQPVIKVQCQRAAFWRCAGVMSSVSRSHRRAMDFQHRTDLGPITYSNTAEAIHYTSCAWILTLSLTDGADSWSIVARLDQSMPLPLAAPRQPLRSL